MRLAQLLFLVALCFNSGYSYALERVALIIGNSNYKNAPLKNPVNDAQDVGERLQQLGFSVDVVLDAGERQMKEAIRTFSRSISGPDKVGLFYFSGHGVELDGQNFLIPLNSDIQVEADVEYEAVNAGRLLSSIDKAGNGLNLVILDACRNNPFQRSFRASNSGLGRVSAPTGTLVMYAAQPGHTAEDGAGRNGTFTKHFLSALDVKGLSVEQVFKKTALAVSAETGKRQVPWVEGVILGEFHFSKLEPEVAAQVPNALPLERNPPPSSAYTDQAEIVFWQSLSGSRDCEDYEAYLQDFPEGRFATLARSRRNRYCENQNAFVETTPVPDKPVTTAMVEDVQTPEADVALQTVTVQASGISIVNDEQAGAINSETDAEIMVARAPDVRALVNACEEKLLADNTSSKSLLCYAQILQDHPSSTDAMIALGTIYENGFGVPADTIKAADWYQRAAVAGDSFAKSKFEQRLEKARAEELEQKLIKEEQARQLEEQQRLEEERRRLEQEKALREQEVAKRHSELPGTIFLGYWTQTKTRKNNAPQDTFQYVWKEMGDFMQQASVRFVSAPKKKSSGDRATRVRQILDYLPQVGSSVSFLLMDLELNSTAWGKTPDKFKLTCYGNSGQVSWSEEFSSSKGSSRIKSFDSMLKKAMPKLQSRVGSDCLRSKSQKG